MARPPLTIHVEPKDQRTLRGLLSGGTRPVRVVLRALALLQLAKGAGAPQIANVIPLTPQVIRRVGHRYHEEGLDRAIYERRRPGPAQRLDEGQKRRIIAMVRGRPPAGHARWTVRLASAEA
jgi:putative transposase